MKQFFKKYQEVLQDERLTRTQSDIISVLINRAEYHNKPFYCYESWIAAEVRCSRRTVIRAIKYFEEIGLVNISKIYNKVTKKTTNYYTVNIDTFNNKVVEETSEVVSGTDEPMVKEDVVEVVNTVKEVEIMNTNDEIPYDLLYPYEAEMIEAMTIPMNTPINKKDNTEVTDEMLNTIYTHLKKHTKKNGTGLVYAPAIKEKYGYSYSSIFKAIQALGNAGDIEYTPIEKDGKIYHNYSVPKEMNKEEYDNLKKEWWEFCVKNAKKIGQDGLTEKQVKSDMSGSVYLFEKRGLQKKDMVELAKVVFDIVTNRSVA